ncbi:hypothetical protein QFZ27_002585 [Inquilinus ginsengisoli]|uniref:DUF308 domain-containing protein n=1 Tax=Inquilinus ginsengisoli TaxID=363840 RepID=UPI003D1FA421
MQDDHEDSALRNQERWLKRYYFTRTVFSAIWVAAAFAIGPNSLAAAAALLVAYPAWDAAANYFDVSRSGGLRLNRTQAINVVVAALQMSMNLVLAVFGAWAMLSGLLQLGTAVGRWKSYGAQWAMILSGGQSALAGVFFIVQARMPVRPSITDVAGYAAAGALYFLVSAVWLSVSELRRKAARASA